MKVWTPLVFPTVHHMILSQLKQKMMTVSLLSQILALKMKKTLFIIKKQK